MSVPNAEGRRCRSAVASGDSDDVTFVSFIDYHFYKIRKSRECAPYTRTRMDRRRAGSKEGTWPVESTFSKT